MCKRIRWPLAGSALVVLLLTGCSKSVSPTSATLEGNTYSNQFFNFQVRVPQGWTIGNKEDFETAVAVRRSGRAQDPKLAEQVEKVSKLLLFAMEKPLGTPTETNRSIFLGYVDARSEPSIQTGKDLETLVIQSLKEEGDRREQLNEPSLVRLGAKEFYRVDFKVGVLDKTIYQAYFATVENRRVLVLTVGAESETDVNRVLAEAGIPQNSR